jgi:outer membrane receptor protein involved in Fe transport
VDPCAGVTATSSDPASVACRAAPGVNANIAANAGVFTLNQADFQGISGYDRGNPNLTEEEGNSWTIGAVIQPEDIAVLDKFDFTVDYYKIDIADAIVQTDRNFILSQCYGGGNPSFCNFVTRRPAAVGANSAGSIEFLDAGVTNSGGEFAEGVDLTVGFNTPIGAGNFNARLSYTHVLDHYQIPLPDEDKDQLSGEVGDSDDKAYLSLGYNIGKFGGTLQTTYLSSAVLDDGFLDAYGLEPGSVGIPSATYLDVQFTWSPGDSYQVFLGANNITDEEPPLVISGLPGDVTGTETDAGTYDAIGRRYYAGVRIKF